MRSKIGLTALFLALLAAGCSLKDPFGDSRESRLLGNLPPETHLFLLVDQDVKLDTLSTGKIDTLIVDAVLDTTPSRQIVYWWGDDPDGRVVGYYYRWNYQTEAGFTTAERDTFYVPIRSFYDVFSFSVWAVDDQGVEDPTPAVLYFPVYNTPPRISFRLNSNPRISGNPNVTSYTFPTRTFVWDVFDADGRETVAAIYYALDDTSNWIRLPGDADQVTLRDLGPGEHRFFVRAEDVSGASSQTLCFPDENDPESPNRWVVKPITGNVLLVNDYAQDQNLYQVQSFYSAILNELLGENGYSIWEIGSSRVPLINSQNSLPYTSTDIEANLSYFDQVIWFAHLGRPNLSAAGLSITRFVNNGGKILISNANEEPPDTTWTFTGIDSVVTLNPGGRLFAGTRVLASFGSDDDEALDLSLEKLVGNRVSSLVPRSNVDVVYRMEPDSLAQVNVPYKGSPVVGVRYRLGSGESIYFSLPLHHCNGEQNLVNVFRHLLFEEFGS
ncbi:hypothetical protein JW992_05185 [candidate division KSB1 bacterium]|nr:hypothetical protein [candidate division KSB1 bacterium]